MSNNIHKIQDAIIHNHHDKYNTDSNTANKRGSLVDSDQASAYGTGTRADTGTNRYGSGGSAPYSSNLESRTDPRVDSQCDSCRRDQNLGGNIAPAGSSYATPDSGVATAGNYDSKNDPRLGSDLDNRRTAGVSGTRY